MEHCGCDTYFERECIENIVEGKVGMMRTLEALLARKVSKRPSARVVVGSQNYILWHRARRELLIPKMHPLSCKRATNNR